jgi:hypothetical protein
MPLSRAQKECLRSEKTPKTGNKQTNKTVSKGPEKQYSQTGPKYDPHGGQPQMKLKKGEQLK